MSKHEEAIRLIIYDSIFFNKKACDSVREIVVGTVFDLEDANIIVAICSDYEAAKPLIFEMGSNNCSVESLINILNKHSLVKDDEKSLELCNEFLKHK